MFAEWRRVLGDRGAFSLIVLAPILYGVLYPQPYLGQVLRDIPIAVVDQDATELSRELVQTLNADEAVKRRGPSRHAGRGAGRAGRAARCSPSSAFPKGTEREVLKGKKARIAAYVDSAYFLLYNRTWQGISGGGRAPFRARSQRVARAPTAASPMPR